MNEARSAALIKEGKEKEEGRREGEQQQQKKKEPRPARDLGLAKWKERSGHGGVLP